MTQSLANVGVAITRPLNQAKKLTALIEQAGGNVISFPLIKTVPLADYSQFEALTRDINSFDWAIFISSNAVHNGMPHIIKHGIPPHLKFAAIGPVTAQELKDFGVQDVLIPTNQFDSESLLALPAMHQMQGKKVMFVRGVGGREVLADILKSRGAQVTFAECYQRVNPQTDCEALALAYAKNKLQAIVVTSSEAMRHLLDLAVEADWLMQATTCVNHARIAETALQMGLKVKVTHALGDEEMLAILSQ